MEYSREEIEEALLELFDLGIIKVEYDENLEARFAIADGAKFEGLIKGQEDV